MFDNAEGFFSISENVANCLFCWERILSPLKNKEEDVSAPDRLSV